MSWQKFSDRARESRKIRRAPLDAVGFWWSAGNYCAEHQTDGFISKDDVADVYRPIGHQVDHGALVRVCVDKGLLIDHGDFLEVKDFLEFNPSKEDQDRKKSNDAKRAAAYRAREKALKKRGIASTVTRDEARDAGVTNGERHADGDREDPSGVRHAPPVPSRPVPVPSRSPSLRSGEESAPPVDLEPGEPDCDHGERLRIPHLVRLWFEREYMQRRGNTPSWTRENVDRCNSIAAWLDKNHGSDPRAALTRLLSGFFSSPRAAQKGFPVAFLATNPDEYWNPLPDAPRASAKLRPSPGTTHEDFQDYGSVEEQLRKAGL